MQKKFNHIFCKRGRQRHAQLRKHFLRFTTIGDIQVSYVCELADIILQICPDATSSTRLIVKAEVPILNRRPDFVIYMPNKALILLEYKTTNKNVFCYKRHTHQIFDTMKNFKSCHQIENRLLGSMILASILLIRNPTKRVNNAICVSFEHIAPKRFII